MVAKLLLKIVGASPQRCAII